MTKLTRKQLDELEKNGARNGLSLGPETLLKLIAQARRALEPEDTESAARIDALRCALGLITDPGVRRAAKAALREWSSEPHE